MAPSRIVSNPLRSFWQQKSHEFARHRSTENLPTTADVVIVGAGYCGTSAAYHLLQQYGARGKIPSIVILESREACSGATGRNGGHLKPDPYNRPYNMLQTLGREEANKVAAFEKSHMDAVQKVVEQEKIDCDFVRTRAYDIFFTDNDWDAARGKIKALREAGIQSARDIEVSSSQDQVEKVARVKGAKGYLSYDTAHLAPYKLITGLLKNLVARGVNLQTFTPVTSVSEAPTEDGSWLIATPRGTIRARTIIHANNAFASEIVPELKGKIVPCRGTACHIVPQRKVPWAPYSYMLRHHDWEYDYLISRTDGSIVVGGARGQFFKDLDSWFDNPDDGALIGPAKAYFDGYMQKHFAGWEDSGAKVESIWTGIMGYTDDGWPYVGELPGKPGQHICAGFTGHGMPQVFLSAEAVVTKIVQGTDYTTLPQRYRISAERMSSTKEHASLAGWRAAIEASRAQEPARKRDLPEASEIRARL